MYPTSREQERQGGGSLEQHLRGLIINNGGPNIGPLPVLPNEAPLPPHMLNASPLDQQAFQEQAYRASQTSHPPAPPQHTPKSPEQNAQGGKKRLNQAQRRQMNANLSIPIDPRPNLSAHSGYNPNSHHGGNQNRGPRNSPQYGYQNPQQNQQFQQQQHQQPYSPRFPNQGHASPYSPRGSYQQGPVHQNQQGQYRQGPNNYQQSQSPGFQSPNFPSPSPTSYSRPHNPTRQLYQPGTYSGQERGRPYGRNTEDIFTQSDFLTKLIEESVPTVAVGESEESEKNEFRALIENACREAITQYEQEDLSNPNFDSSTVELKCFGSMSSGFATKASDMDLALLTPLSQPPADSPESMIPRLLERKLLDLGYGARLLTRTRVPIIKLCQFPTEKLRKDLLEERTKFEREFNCSIEEGGVLNMRGKNEDTGLPKESEKPRVEPLSVAEVVPKKPAEKSEPAPRLKQKDNQSLGDYYNSAKRLLRKLGGRDVTALSADLTEDEGRILNEVCKAFISGLSSNELVTRLRGYHTIAHLFDSSLPFVQRTLSGVWTQIDGEQQALAFKYRTLKERDEERENMCRECMDIWYEVQGESGPGVESLAYNKRLFLASERFRHIGSLQLAILEQVEHERPGAYGTRAITILEDLSGQDRDRRRVIMPQIVAHYITGIYDTQIKDRMQTMAADETHSTGIDPNLNLYDVILEHRVLQLASDYECALEKELFDEADRPVIEQYVALLRTRQFDGFDSTVTNEHKALIQKVRSLPDPSLISSGKPRDRYSDHLEFPKTGIGIQCDINFSANLALHNTQLLRCYSLSDTRVKQLILFVKHWAKMRGVNTPYRGTLSSYGYVLMVLHYLVNIAQPFVCRNLQIHHKETPTYLPPAEIEARTTCEGRDVRFWRHETEIEDLASRGLLNHNKDTLGALIRGFFEYFAQNGQMSTVRCRGFDWGRDVLSLRTLGGLLSKQQKGWTSARTETSTKTIRAPKTPYRTPVSPAHPPAELNGQDNRAAPTEEAEVIPKPKTVEETKEIRHRYLFAIEDPFELDHNVARTVTHNGIVSIRDEFRRAWRIIQGIGKNHSSEGLLDVVVTEEAKSDLREILDLIHTDTTLQK